MVTQVSRPRHGRWRSTIASRSSAGEVCRRRHLAVESRRAERLRRLGRTVADEQRALERHGEQLEQAPCAFLVRVDERSIESRERGVEAGIRAGGEAHLRQERLGALGLPRQRAQHVQRVHVARALPDRVDRALAVEPRQLRLLDVAVAAEALERLRDEGGVRLQIQNLATAVASRRNGPSASS